jgi:uncharacterized phosphosugar-binding protein
VSLSRLRAGDVLVVSSVSGRNGPPVELALACRERGVRTVGLTSMPYTSRVVSLHPSGKRLFEAVDVTIDIGVPYGDAGVAIEGLEHEAVPLSGVAMVVSGWLLWGTVMARMGAEGDAPSVFVSHNREGGPERNEKSRSRYQERGY